MDRAAADCYDPRTMPQILVDAAEHEAFTKGLRVWAPKAHSVFAVLKMLWMEAPEPLKQRVLARYPEIQQDIGKFGQALEDLLRVMKPRGGSPS